MNNKNAVSINPKILFSCFLAGCLEMYDFILFGFLGTLIHANYLSFLTAEAGQMVTYLLFAVGFLFRPLGSLIFGYIGDVYGRKRAVVLSVSFMGTASLAMALLPSYAIGGSLVCWAIVLIRIIQGISVGGEYSGVTIYAIEHTNRENIGIIGSIVVAGGALGVLLATIISKLVQNPALPEYSWRLAFLVGFGLSIIGYFIRKNLTESPLFIKGKGEKNTVPLLQGWKFFKKEFLASFLLAGANNANFYFIIIFLPGFLKTSYPNSPPFDTLTLTVIMLAMLPLIGWLSDKIGRFKILFVISLCFVFYQYFLVSFLINASSPLISYIHVVISATLIASFVSTTNVFVLEIFPTSCRFSCGALSYSLGTALLGGTAPFVCSYIISSFGSNPNYLAYYISFLSLLGFLGLFLVRDFNQAKSEKTMTY